jgi:hypothetical protein
MAVARRDATAALTQVTMAGDPASLPIASRTVSAELPLVKTTSEWIRSGDPSAAPISPEAGLPVAAVPV